MVGGQVDQYSTFGTMNTKLWNVHALYSKLLKIDMIVFIPELDLPTLSRCHIMTA